MDLLRDSLWLLGVVGDVTWLGPWLAGWLAGWLVLWPRGCCGCACWPSDSDWDTDSDSDMDSVRLLTLLCEDSVCMPSDSSDGLFACAAKRQDFRLDF